MTEKRFYVAESNLIDGYCIFDRKKKYAFHPRPRKADCLNDAHILNELDSENKEFKVLLDEMSDRNNEIWLDDGRIYRLRKIFKGKWRRVDG